MNMLKHGILLSIVAASGIILTSSTALAQSAADISKLQEMGYQPLQDGVWQVTHADGSVHRTGFGHRSLSFLLDAIDQKKSDLQQTTMDEAAVAQLNSLKASIQTALDLSESHSREENGDILKGAGNNGCTTGTFSSTAWVDPTNSNAYAHVSSTGFGPATPGSVRIVLALVSKGGVTSLDFDANFGGSLTPIGAASASVPPGTGTCFMYAFAQHTSITNGCSAWSDSVTYSTCL